jgi:hypothetical protein
MEYSDDYLNSILDGVVKCKHCGRPNKNVAFNIKNGGQVSDWSCGCADIFVCMGHAGRVLEDFLKKLWELDLEERKDIFDAMRDFFCLDCGAVVEDYDEECVCKQGDKAKDYADRL